ncbi:MAG TPA: glutathione transferase GstA [Rhizomicrobium sp.]|jgi:glutathione S-transferase
MKLYYSAGTCSLAVHIVAREAGIVLELERVDIRRTLHMTASGVDYVQINPTGYVPVLQLDDGSLLSESAVIVQYLADLKPQSGMMPPAGLLERYRLQSWLNFIATELHKMYSPWLFHPEFGADVQKIVRSKITGRLTLVENYLADDGPYLTGEKFTAADAYLFVIVGWSAYAKVDLTPFPYLRAFMDSVKSRPKVREALEAERVKVAA